MGVVSGAVLEKGGKVLGVVPAAMVKAGGEGDKGESETGAVHVVLNEEGREMVCLLFFTLVFLLVYGWRVEAD